MTKKNVLFKHCELSTGVYVFLSIYSLLVNAYFFIPFFIYGVVKNKKLLPLFVGLFFAILSYQFVPLTEFDLYRHYESYGYFLQHGDFLYKTKDLYLESLFYFGRFFSLNKEFIYFISVVIYYTCMMTVIMKLKAKLQLDGLFFYVVLFLFLFSNTVVEITGIRFTTALGFICLFIYYSYFEERKGISYFFLIFAVLSHFSLIILPAVILMKNLIQRVFYSRKLLVFIVFFSIFSGFYLVEPIVSSILLGIEQILNVNIGAATYTSGMWGADRVELHGYSQSGILYEKIKLAVSIMIQFVLTLSFILDKNFIKDNLMKLFVACSITIYIFIPFDTVYMRYQFLLVVIALVIYAKKPYKVKNIDGTLIGVSMICLKLLMQVVVGFLSTYIYFYQNLNNTFLSTNLIAALMNVFGI